MTIQEQPPPRVIVAHCCDFCNEDAVVLYRARPTSTRAGRGVSVTVTFTRTCWRACETCRALIASGRRDELAERGVRAYVDRHAFEGNRQQRRAATRELRATQRRTHDDFWRARIDAAPVPLAEAESENRPGLAIATFGAS